MDVYKLFVFNRSVGESKLTPEQKISVMNDILTMSEELFVSDESIELLSGVVVNESERIADFLHHTESILETLERVPFDVLPDESFVSESRKLRTKPETKKEKAKRMGKKSVTDLVKATDTYKKLVDKIKKLYVTVAKKNKIPYKLLDLDNIKIG